MDAQNHEFFNQNIKKFNDAEAMFKGLADLFSTIRNDVIRWENENVSLERRVKEKQQELEQLEKTIKERLLMQNQGMAQLMESINKRQLENIERENEIRRKEQLIAELQDKANRLLLAAEQKASAASVSVQQFPAIVQEAPKAVVQEVPVKEPEAQPVARRGRPPKLKVAA